MAICVQAPSIDRYVTDIQGLSDAGVAKTHITVHPTNVSLPRLVSPSPRQPPLPLVGPVPCRIRDIHPQAAGGKRLHAILVCHPRLLGLSARRHRTICLSEPFPCRSSDLQFSGLVLMFCIMVSGPYARSAMRLKMGIRQGFGKAHPSSSSSSSLYASLSRLSALHPSVVWETNLCISVAVLQSSSRSMSQVHIWHVLPLGTPKGEHR